MLKGEGAKVQSLGSATVGGTVTTHYRVTIDTAKALEAKGLTSPLLAAAATLPASIPADVWIGKDGLVRQVKLALGTAHGHLAMTMNLTDYGTAASISAPRAATCSTRRSSHSRACPATPASPPVSELPGSGTLRFRARALAELQEDRVAVGRPVR